MKKFKIKRTYIGLVTIILVWYIVCSFIAIKVGKYVNTIFLAMFGFGIIIILWPMILYFPLKRFQQRHPGIVFSKFIVYNHSLGYVISLDIAIISLMISFLLSSIPIYMKYVILSLTLLTSIYLAVLSMNVERAYLVEAFQKHVYESRNFKHQCQIRLLIKNLFDNKRHISGNKNNFKSLKSQKMCHYKSNQLTMVKSHSYNSLHDRNNTKKGGSNMNHSWVYNFIRFINYGTRKRRIENKIRNIEYKQIYKYIENEIIGQNVTQNAQTNTMINGSMKHYANSLIRHDASYFDKKAGYSSKIGDKSKSSCTK